MADMMLEGLSTKRLLDLFDAAKHDYGRAAAARKLQALRALRTRKIRQAGLLAKYHETLCFLQAYPDSPELLALVEDTLAGFHSLVQDARRHTAARNHRQLDNTGIAGTSISYPYSYTTVKWLLRRFPHDVSVDWKEFKNEERLLILLPEFVAYLENEALDDPEIETKRWLTLGQEGKGDLAAMLELFEESGFRPQARDALYELLDLPVRWRLQGRGASRTAPKLPTATVFYQTRPLSRRKGGLAGLIRKPLPSVRHVRRREAAALIDASWAALAVRLREMVPLLYVNPQDVWTVEAERGVHIVLMGMLPSHRLSLECTYFFLLLKNGVPVGYGCASTLVDRTEVAANVFESFRRGESAFLYAQLLRAFHHVFGATSFLLDRSQIGYEDNEGIKSGAFWFYHKMGFRPVSGEAQRLAEREQARMEKDRSYRSPAAVLRRLALSDMLLKLDRKEPFAGRVRPGNIGRLVTAFIGRQFEGRRAAAVKSSMDRLARILPLGPLRRFTRGELEAIRRLSLLVVQIPDLDGWSPRQKEDLVALMAAKGSVSEIPYARRLARHRRFLQALALLSKQGRAL